MTFGNHATVSRLGSALELARRAPSAVIYVFVAGLVAVIPGLAVPMLIRVFLNQVIVTGDLAWRQPILIGLIACAVVIAVVTWLQWRVLTFVAVRLSASDSASYAWHALRLPPPALQRLNAGDLTGRAAKLQISAFQSGMLVPLAFVNLFTLVVYAVAMLVLDWRIGVAAVAIVAIAALVNWRMLEERSPMQADVDRTALDLYQHSSQVVTAIETIKASAEEQKAFAQWMVVRSEAAEASSVLGRQGQRMGLVPPLTQSLGIGAILAIGTVLVFDGHLTLGTLVASQSLLAAMLVPAGLLVWIGRLLESVASTQRMVGEVFDIADDPEVVDPETPVQPSSTDIDLALDGIVFGYDREREPLFDGVNLRIPSGSWTAVVGPSGSGKSSLARLAIGEFQPWSGTVSIGGVARLQLARDARRDLIGYVPQYPVLIPGTILENIRLFDETISSDRVRQALETACILEAIDRRPGGLMAQVGPSGHGFSGGEVQRLAIARALVRQPSVLVLDEATSALDPIVEADLEGRLRRLGLTCLVVAHRISTVRDADEIVVLVDGAIRDRGTFEDIAASGFFAESGHA